VSPFRFKLNFNSLYSNVLTMQYPISDFFDDTRSDHPPGMAILLGPLAPPKYLNFRLVFPTCNGIFFGLL
jgi:hypothetical protein